MVITPQQGTAVLAQGPATGSVPIEALQAQVAQLSQQLATLRAERDVLLRRVRSMPANELRVQLEAQGRDLVVSVTQTEMQLEGVKAQIASRMGVSTNLVGPSGTIVVPPPFNPSRRPDPDMIVGMSFVLMISIALPLSIAHARRIWRGKPKEISVSTTDETPSRLDRIENAVEAIAIEIERVAEGQRFVTKIMAERPAAVVPPVAAVPKANAMGMPEAGLGEPKPFLALGAGPIEPIRVAERQAVRQSITPH